MNYEYQISKVIEYIGQHLDDKLTLSQLSGIACFSKYHFHRLFTAYTGLSLQQYIRWLRLKRAAHQLIVENDKSIIDIAINAGFESHESFTRAFKQSCGITSSEFRSQSSWHLWEKQPYCLPTGRYAVAVHKGSRENIGETVYSLYRGWLPSSNEELGDLPCIFCYYNFDHEVAETELLTECWLLLK